MAELYARVCLCMCACVLLFFFFLPRPDTCVDTPLTHLFDNMRCLQPQITVRDKGKGRKIKHTNITRTFFCTGREQEGSGLFQLRIFFKTMGFNSHIRLFCSHWQRVESGGKTWLKDKNIFSPLLPLLISKPLFAYFQFLSTE